MNDYYAALVLTSFIVASISAVATLALCRHQPARSFGWRRLGIVAIVLAGIKGLDTMFGGVPRLDAATTGTVWLLAIGLPMYLVARYFERRVQCRLD